ncbi:MAG: aminopeptidase [Clostridia bacterium]
MDERMTRFAHKLVHYCVSVQPGENVLISVSETDAYPLVQLLIREIYAAGGTPFVQYEIASITRELLKNCTRAQLHLQNELDAQLYGAMQAQITIRGLVNASELSDVADEQMRQYVEERSAVRKFRQHLKWVGLRYPNNALAQMAGMSLEAYEDFHYTTCNMDYEKLAAAMAPLARRMEETDRVRIVGPGTELNFSIKGIPAVPCDGKINIPDGEVFTAPVRDSVNGVVTFNLPSVYQSLTFENIRLKFEQGKIVEATCNHTQKLNEILDIDPGARYLGEFSFGVSPVILKPTGDGGIDEKLAGSIHLTPGACYKAEADNGNDSQIHWDLVLLQTKAWGGGEIYFDDRLIRKDGLFVPEDLQALNPQALQ